MGADMLLATFTIEEGSKPDFKKGHDLIKEYAKSWKKNGIPSDLDRFEDAKELEAHMHTCLHDVEVAVNGSHREVTSLTISGLDVYATGGMSWGDSPSDLYNCINDLYDCGDVFEVCGINPSLNYKEILNKILTQKEVLPMLMSLDPNLDKMISNSLSKKEKPCKKKK